MKGWTKRRVALILALALLASQMSACKKEAVPSSKPAVGNNTGNSAVVAQKEETQPQEEEISALEWLVENLKNIHESLLSGDYAKVIEQLLEKDELVDDARYNALLYIAYMGNGNEDSAAALLANGNLDMDAFTDAFLESVEALKGNADIAAIQQKLMEHLLGLAETNPAGFDAAARIGLKVQNDNPEDPTAYAVRYIAALAAGDEAAMAAILAEAEANGVSPDALATTTAEYIERVKLTTVSVMEEGKGRTTTTYTEGGAVVGTEIVDSDGSGYHYSKLDGIITAEVKYDLETGKLISKTQYICLFTTDKNTGKIKAIPTGAKEVYHYTDGVLDSMVSYDENGDMGYELILNSDGEVLSGTDYSSGEGKAVSEAQRNVLNFEVDDKGNIISRTIPVVDKDGNIVSKFEERYIYDNPAGAVAGWTEYEGLNVNEEWNITYSYQTVEGEDGKKTAEAYYNTHDVKDYKLYTTYSYQHQGGDVISSTTVVYTEDWTTITMKMDVDRVNHTSVVSQNGNIFNWVLDSSNTYQLYADVELGDKSSGAEYVKIYKTYKGMEHVANLDVYYDADGRILKEDYYTIDGKTPEGNDNAIANTLMEYTYDTSGRVATKTTTACDYITFAYSSETIEYEYDGNKVVKETYGDGIFTTAVVKHIYDENGRKVKTEKYDVDWLYEDETLSQTTDYTYIQNEDGTETVTSEQKDAYGSVTGTRTVDVTYNGSGKKDLESSYTIDSEGNKIPESVIQYSYNENGDVSGYSVTAINADGTPGKTITYTSDGHAYQTELTPEVAMMIMRMTRGENTSENGGTEDENTELIEEEIPDTSEPVEEEAPEATEPEEETPEVTEPEEETPEATESEEETPEASEPEEETPEATEPEEESPEATEPVEEAPEATEPEEEAPEATEPEEEAPEATEPVEEAPEATEPEEEAPEATEPVEEAPEATEPEEEVPEVTEPTEEVPEATESAEEEIPAPIEPVEQENSEATESVEEDTEAAEPVEEEIPEPNEPVDEIIPDPTEPVEEPEAEEAPAESIPEDSAAEGSQDTALPKEPEGEAISEETGSSEDCGEE